MFVLNGKSLPLDAPFSHDGVMYPANWLRLASPEDRAAIGITEQAEPPVWDQRFYWGYSEDGELIPKQLNDEPVFDEKGDPVLDENGVQRVSTGLKTQWAKEQKAIAGSLLSGTDWYVVREAETGVAVPADVLGYRQEVRAASNARESEILATTSVEELKELLFGSPYIYHTSPETGETVSTINPDVATPWPQPV